MASYSGGGLDRKLQSLALMSTALQELCLESLDQVLVTAEKMTAAEREMAEQI